MPVFHGEALVGAVLAGSSHKDAFTKKHLRLLALATAHLAALFPEPANEPDERPDEHAGSAPVAAPVAPAAGPEAHVAADGIGRVREWDEAAEALFGIAREEALSGRVAVFHRGASGRLIPAGLVDELTARGRNAFRVVGFDPDGTAVLCEVELSSVRTPAGARGFRGRFRRIQPDALAPRAELQFDVAVPYAFDNALMRR